MKKKYETIEEHGRFRVRALRGFTNKASGRTIEKGEIGGWVDGEHNLSQRGTCWISDEASVNNRGRVRRHAIVSENAKVEGGTVTGKSIVEGNATVRDTASITGKAVVEGNATVEGDAWVGHDAMVGGEASLGKGAHVAKGAIIGEDSRVEGDSSERRRTKQEQLVVAFKDKNITSREEARRVLASWRNLKAACEAIVEATRQHGYDIVGGPSGVLAVGMSAVSQKDWFSTQGEATEGKEIRAGTRVLLVDDVVTTGRAIREALDQVRRQGGRPVAIATLVSGESVLGGENIEYYVMLP